MMRTVNMAGSAPYRIGGTNLFSPPAWAPSWSAQGSQQTSRNPRLGQAAPNVTMPSDTYNAKRALLASAAKRVVDSGNALVSVLDSVYNQYKNRGNPGFFQRLAKTYIGLYGLDLDKWLYGSSDAQAILKLQSANKLGYNWMNQVKDQWFGENPTYNINLEQEAIDTDNDIAVEVEDSFDRVIEANARVSNLMGQIQTLPENLLIQGYRTFWGGLSGSVMSVAGDLSNIGKGILDLLHAVGQAVKGTGAAAKDASSTPWAPIIGVGLVAVALFLLLK